MFNSVGKRVTRYDGIGHVTGKTRYVSDIKMPGTLVAKTLRSPYHRAKINSIDVTEAKKVKGVYAVITKDDLKHNLFSMGGDHHVLVDEIVRYKGQNIAAVAAVDKATALLALSKIKLDIEELPCVLDPEEAIKEGAVQVRPEGNNFTFEDGTFFRKIRRGDVEAGFAKADHIVEGRYTTPAQEHAPLETTASLAYVDGAGVLNLHSKSQGIYFTLGDLMNLFGLPRNKLRIIGGTIGGGFGALNSVHTDHIAGLLALKTGKPVSFVLTREEEMMYSTVRSPWIFHIKDGVTKDGVIIAREMNILHDCGAYTELGLYAVEKNASLVGGANLIENLAINSRMVYTNKMPSGSMRGFGVNVGQYAEQVQVDRLAKAIGMKPIEIRMINAFREGDKNHTGNELVAISTIETLQRAAKLAGYDLPAEYAAMSSKEGRV